jgi:hypothetical protein
MRTKSVMISSHSPTQFKEVYTMSEKLAAVTRFFASRPAIIITGAIIGLLAPLLQNFLKISKPSRKMASKFLPVGHA